MGGINSGRWPGTPTIESSGALILDVNQVVRALGGGDRGTLALNGSLAGRPVAVTLAIELADDGTGTMHVEDASTTPTSDSRCYALRDRSLRHPSSATTPLAYTVALTATPCRFGGHRWWFRCLRTGERVGKLYLPNGGARFLSRKAYGLGYRSQRVAPAERVHTRLARLHAKLGMEYTGLARELPARPQGMRQATYWRVLIDIIASRRELAGQARG